MTRPTIQFELTDAAGAPSQHSLPATFRICPVCDGAGKRVNAAIDGNGISPEEFIEDPDFEESYFAGDYDVVCDRCSGARVIKVLDRSSARREDPDLLRRYDEELLERERQSRENDDGERWLRRAEGLD